MGLWNKSGHLHLHVRYYRVCLPINKFYINLFSLSEILCFVAQTLGAKTVKINANTCVERYTCIGTVICNLNKNNNNNTQDTLQINAIRK